MFFALFFLTLTAAFVVKSPVKQGLPSYCLSAQVTEQGNTRRTDYVDTEGNITFATDKHYASIIRTYEDGKVVLEEYFDESGNPSVQELGHCALLRHFNTDDLADRITYLDESGQPVVTSSGYDTIHRTYNVQRLAETDTYYIGDEQVQNAYGFYAYHREYNNSKQLVELAYLDENGQLATHRNGYAVITRSYNEDGRVEYQYYFDTDRCPAAVFSGYYGLYREYDEFGNTTLTTYLDDDGRPLELNHGYATTVSTYGDDGSVKSVRYFDAEGNPVTVGRNQYGYENVNGRRIYLDENGERMRRLDNILNTHPVIVLMAGVVLTAVTPCLTGKGRTVFLILYILFIGYMTFAYRETGASQGQFELFWSYKQIFSSETIREEIINNIWLFVPLGAVLYDPGHKNRWIWAITLSLLIETLQYVTGAGLSEFDDLVSNSVGAFIGYEFAAGADQVIHLCPANTKSGEQSKVVQTRRRKI